MERFDYIKYPENIWPQILYVAHIYIQNLKDMPVGMTESKINLGIPNIAEDLMVHFCV